MAFWHGQIAYYLVSAMAVLSLACVLRLRGIVASGPKQPARERLPAGRFRRLYLTFQAEPIIRGAVLLVAAGICTMSMHSAALVFLLQEHGLPASVYGMTMIATATAYIVAALTVRRWMGGRELNIIGLCLVGSCILEFSLGLWSLNGYAITLVPLLALWAVDGYFFGGMMVCYLVVMQTRSPKDKLGLIMAASASVLAVVMQAAPLAGVAIVEWHSAGLAYALSAVPGLIMLLYIKLRFGLSQA
jgi:hypothetical protein